jgi:hypothetical protein
MAYTAVVLTPESRDLLIERFIAAVSPPALSPTAEHKIKAHHMTCDMKPAAKSIAAEFIGQEVELEVVRWGASYAAPIGNPDWRVDIVAVEVKCAVPSKNAIKHVTLYHHEAVKPMKSNDITEWSDVEPFAIRGVVQEVA